MELKVIETKEILDFEKEMNRPLVVKEIRPEEFTAQFRGAEKMEKGFLISSYGRGKTVDEAIINYCDEIKNSTIVFNAYTPQRTEVKVPKLIHTKNDEILKEDMT